MAGSCGGSLRDFGPGRGDDLPPFIGVPTHPPAPGVAFISPRAPATLPPLASRSTTCCGVLAGASNPNHPLSSYPGTPASCMVGTCGMSLEREGDAIANILPLPPAASAMAAGGPENITS